MAYSFAMLPGLIVGTGRVATVQRRVAREACRCLPLVTLDVAFELPVVQQRLQWHRHHAGDPGLLWLREIMLAAAREMDTGA
jgi:hypothetical protein